MARILKMLGEFINTSFMQIIDSPLVKITYDKNIDQVSFSWHRFANSENLRQAYIESIQVIPCPSRWLLDKEKIKVISPEDQKWLVDFWCSEVVKKTVKIAFLDSLDFFGQLSIKNIITKINSIENDVYASVFKTEIEAKKWLDCHN